MDGYRLTTEIRTTHACEPACGPAHFTVRQLNESMVKKVGCDNFLSKFQPDKLEDVVRERFFDAGRSVRLTLG